MRTSVPDKHPPLPRRLITPCGVLLISCCQLHSWILISSTATKLLSASTIGIYNESRAPYLLLFSLKIRLVRSSFSSPSSCPYFILHVPFRLTTVFQVWDTTGNLVSLPPARTRTRLEIVRVPKLGSSGQCCVVELHLQWWDYKNTVAKTLKYRLSILPPNILVIFKRQP